jgi:ABC-type sugar transport system ATPase subunit
MGRAIVRNPKVFLFDEPLSNLDAKLRVHMRLQLARLHRDLGATMIYVTHDQTEAMTLADRICVMNNGELMQIGTPMSLFSRPENSFVAGFIGSPSMNILPAEIDKETPRVIAEDFSLTLTPSRHKSLIEQGIGRVLLGLRPQHLHPCNDLELPGFNATIDVVEPLGAEAYLYLNMGESNIIASTTDKLPQEGETLRFGLASNHIHLFSEDGHVRLEDEDNVG